MSQVLGSYLRHRRLLAPAIFSLALASFAIVNIRPTHSSDSLAAPPRATIAEPRPQTASRPDEAYGRLPQSFEVNVGQADAPVRFLSRGHGYSLFLTPTEAVLALNKPTPEDDTEQPAAPHAIRRSRKISRALAGGHRQAVLRMRLVSANAEPFVEGFDELSGKSNYLLGDEPDKWLTNVPTFAGVRYREVYPGVDMIYRGDQGQLEFDFVVAPGADARAVTLGFDGPERVGIDGAGDLVLSLDGERVTQRKPAVYQEIDGVRRPVAARYVLQGRRRVGFEIGEYDPAFPLVIDPVLSYSTYLGGSGGDSGFSVAVDDTGSAYLTGLTASLDFPVRNPLQPNLAGTRSDVFVAKLNPSGTALVYSTYVGGSVGDVGHGIDVDAAGNAYVCGVTGGSISFDNFPTVNALDATYGGTDDAFLFKLNPAGSALVYSTYLGGANTDIAYEVAVDRTSGEAYLSGITLSYGFPVTPGALKSSLSFGDVSDAFVAKFSADGSALVYSTYLGGGFGAEAAYDIDVDFAGSAYVTGETASSRFPVTPGAFQTVCTGCEFFRSDAFLAKLNPQGTGLVYASYLGGSLDDYGFGLSVDAGGNAYVAGQTQSSVFASKPFPTTPGSFRPTGGLDAFVAKFSADGSALVYSTYLGGSVTEEARSVAVDAAGNAHVTGKTRSADFPLADPLQPTIPALGFDNVFITTLNPSGSALVFSTYFGSGEGRHVVTDSAGGVYVTGVTYGRLPTASPVQPSHAGSGDAFVAKLGGATVPPPPPTPTPQSPTPPASPSNLSANTVLKSQINLAWADNSGNEDGFHVERCAGSTCTDFAQLARVGANVNTYADVGLAKNTAYRYRVRSFNAAGESGYSNIAAAKTPRK